MSFGTMLKKVRQEYNLTQEEFANKINSSRSNIANYENNKNMPSVEILIKISETFNCSIDYLLGKSKYRNYSDLIHKQEIKNRIEELENQTNYNFHFYCNTEDIKRTVKTKMQELLEEK